MKKVLKWTGIVLGAVLLLAAVTVFYLQNALERRLAKRYDVQPAPVAIPADSASLEAGKTWVAVLCRDCHGEQLAGNVMFEDPALGTFSTPNLTPAGIGGTYTDLDWDRALRHGVAKDGRPLMLMPSETFGKMSDEHVGQIIAFLKTVPAKTEPIKPTKATLLGSVLIQLGAFGDDMIPAESIDHKSPGHVAPERGVTPKYGEYLVNVTGCRGCHGPALNGAKHPDPSAPMPSPNLTPGGALASWGEAGFIKTLRTGVTPAGKELQQKYMPWKQVGAYHDDQLKAIYAYLMSLEKMDMAELK